MPIKLSRKVDFGNKILFIDGLTRSGKSMLGPICSSFEDVEIERVEEFIEYTGTLHRLGKIDEDAAIAYLKQKADMCLYNSMIGRDTNFRRNDHSSVWRSPRPDEYFRRLLRNEGPEVVEDIRARGTIFQNQTHDQLMNHSLYHKAFGDRLFIIEMMRHPVDLMDSWMRRGWGKRFGADPLSFTFTFEFNDVDLPYYAYGWENEYLDSSEESRVLLMIHKLWNSCFSVYEGLSQEQKNNVLIIPFESFVQSPLPYIDKIGALLGKKASKEIGQILNNERCPREYKLTDHQVRRDKLYSALPSAQHRLMDELIQSYDEVCRDHAV